MLAISRFFLISIFLFSFKTNGQIIESDYDALMAFYNATNGASWTNNTGWGGPNDASISTWFGLTVVGDRVVQINLTRNALSGSLPQEVGELTALTHLLLGPDTPFPAPTNTIEGSIPASILNLTNLIRLNLQFNRITGTIPEDIGDLVSLIRLELSSNRLSGSIPESITAIPNLQHLALGGNQLTGLIPTQIGNLNNLRFFSVANNQLSGNLPVSLGDLTQLTSLQIQFNQLSGNIPIELSGLSAIQTLYFNNNLLTGGIPTWLGDLTTLTILQGDSNPLGGTIPETLSNLTNLTTLTFSNCQLTGTIPDAIGNISNLAFLRFDANQLTGNIPANFGDLNLLTRFYLNNNQLTGPLPVGLANNTGFTDLRIQNNFITSVPDFSAATGLNGPTNFQTQNNRLTFESIEPNIVRNPVYSPQRIIPSPGNITLYEGEPFSVSFEVGGTANSYQWSRNATTITGADADTFTIPAVSLSDAGTYTLSITNSLAPSLTLNTEGIVLTVLEPTPLMLDSLALVAFYISTNGDNWTNNSGWLVGPLATWHGVTLSGGRVTQIILANNALSGTLPTAIGNLTALNVLRLGQLTPNNNTIGGPIPPEIGNLVNLTQLWLNNNQLSGNIPTEIGNLSNLTDLRLYSNQLSGNIPGEIGNLSNLTILYLQSNQLNGNIPIEIGNLISLIDLRLSGNQLNGTIPPQLGNLSNLVTLELTSNQLSGELPTQLQSLTNLETFLFSVNQITGGIPVWIGELSALIRFGGDFNPLGGNIPTEIGNLTNLVNFSCTACQLTGSIPNEIGNLSELSFLLLNSNQLTGELPASFVNLNLLRRLLLNNNQLSGPIPTGLSNNTDFTDLRLHNNLFTFIPDFSLATGLNGTTNFQIQNNRLTFESIEPNLVRSPTYSPQAQITGIPDFKVAAGSPFTLNYTVGGADNVYQWFKDGNPIVGATNNTYEVLSASVADAGNYYLRITNTSATALTLTTAITNLQVQPEGATVADVAICLGDDAELTASGAPLGADYLWYENEADITPVFTGNPFIVNAPPASITYYVSFLDGALESLKTAVTITVIVPTAISMEQLIDPTVCNGTDGGIQLAGLAADTDYTVDYAYEGAPESAVFTSNAGGELLITGLSAGAYSNITVTLAACTSNVLTGPFNLTEPLTPSITVASITDQTSCSIENGEIVLNFTDVPDGIFTIAYDGGTFTVVEVLINTATIITGPGVFNDLQITLSGCTSEEGVNATVLANYDVIDVPLAVDKARCDDGVVILRASGATGAQTYRWYTDAVGETPIPGETSETYTTSVLTATTTYYVSIFDGFCESARVPVEAIILTNCDGTFIVNSVSDTSDETLGDGICADAFGRCTLRAAMEEANASGIRNKIEFEIPGEGPHRIQPTSALPTLVYPVVIDARTQSGYSFANPQVVIDGSQTTGVGGILLTLEADKSEFYGLVVGNFTHGMTIRTTQNIIQECFFGVDADGSTSLPNSQAGIFVQSGKENQIGGDRSTQRNIISGQSATNAVGILLEDASGNVIQGNYLGLARDGRTALSNSYAIRLLGASENNQIGGPFGPLGNLISGNTRGISVEGTAKGTIIRGNTIGLDVDDEAMGNTTYGIRLAESVTETTLGGDSFDARNVVAGSSGGGSYGIGFAGTKGTFLRYNYIGTNTAGDAARGNFYGVYFTGEATTNTIEYNLISGNSTNIYLLANAGNNRIRGNTIGTDISGSFSLRSATAGIDIRSNGNVIGGPGSQGNLISGINPNAGISLRGEDNLIVGNWIGPNREGTEGLSSGSSIFLFGANNNVIGSTDPTLRNVISGSTTAIYLESSSQNTILGNYIGLGPDGLQALPNVIGISINGSSSDNQIGGSLGDSTNYISGNSRAIYVSGTGGGNTIQGNIIGLNINDDAVPNTGNWIIWYVNQMPTLIGGSSPIFRNIISGNDGEALFVSADNPQLTLTHNYFGTTPDGLALRANSGVALFLQTSDGSQSIISDNVFSGSAEGVRLWNGTVNYRIVRNKIGTDRTGNVAIPNGIGVRFNLSTTHSNVIGGPEDQRNIISGNTLDGIRLTSGTQNNQVVGNWIGVAADGIMPLPNGGYGIEIQNDVNDNRIGGESADEANVIAHNALGGIRMFRSVFNFPMRNQVVGNSIFSNGGLGVQLAATGPNPNDPVDADEGANGLQNYPIISTSFQLDVPNRQLDLSYFVPSDPQYSEYPIRVEFFLGDASRQGRTLIYVHEFSSDDYFARRPKALSIDLSVVSFSGDDLPVATATTADGNTSEFGFIVPDVPFISDMEVFEGFPAVLTAGGAPVGGNYRWYTSLEQVAPVFTGNPYTTAPLTEETVFYLSAIDQFGNESMRIAVRVTLLPFVNTPEVTDVERCGEGSVTLTATGATGTESYRWFTQAEGGNPIPGQTSASFTTEALTATTTFYVSIISEQNVESERVPVQVVIKPIPAAPVATEFFSRCNAGEITLSVFSAEENILYQWYAPNQDLISGANGPSFTVFLGQGAYTYSATVISDGCESPATEVNAAVGTTAAPEITAAQGLVLCEDGSIQLTGPEGMQQYTWSTGEETRTITVTEPGTYTLSVTDAVGCTTDAAEVTVSLVTPPPGTISYIPGLLRANEALSYQWFRNGQPIPGAQGRDLPLPALQFGLYHVVVTYANGCQATSEPFEYLITAMESASPSSIFVYPNPFTHRISVGWDGSEEPSGWRLIDARGTIVLTWNGHEIQEMDVSFLPSGLYILEVRMDTTTIRHKVVKK